MKEITKLRKTFIKTVNANLELLSLKPTRFAKKLTIGDGFLRSVLNGKRNISLDNCAEIIDELKKIAEEKNIEILNNYFTD